MKGSLGYRLSSRLTDLQRGTCDTVASLRKLTDPGSSQNDQSWNRAKKSLKNKRTEVTQMFGERVLGPRIFKVPGLETLVGWAGLLQGLIQPQF